MGVDAGEYAGSSEFLVRQDDTLGLAERHDVPVAVGRSDLHEALATTRRAIMAPFRPQPRVARLSLPDGGGKIPARVGT